MSTNDVSNHSMDPRESYEMLNDNSNVQNVLVKYNMTLSSSAAIERGFSQSNITFTPHRIRIFPENFEKLLFIKRNRKWSYKQKIFESNSTSQIISRRRYKK